LHVAHLLDFLFLLIELCLHALHLVFFVFVEGSEEAHDLLAHHHIVQIFGQEAFDCWPDICLFLQHAFCHLQVLIRVPLLELSHLLELAILVLCLRQVQLVALPPFIELLFSFLLGALRYESFGDLDVDLLAPFVDCDDFWVLIMRDLCLRGCFFDQ